MKPPLEFMSKHKIDSDEVWEVRRGGAWAIKHAALERVATAENITFDPPVMLETNGIDKVVALCVTGHLKDRVDWSIGEASPANNKNSYPYAMAEKRAKDRVTLKLLNAHGSFYSESEADEFDRPNGEKGQVTLPKKDAKEIYEKMQREVRAATSRDHLKQWMVANKDRIKILPEDWQDILRLQCEEMLADLRNHEAA